MIVGAVFPEGLPFPEIERHAALGVYYHREQHLVRGCVEKLRSGVPLGVGRDVQEFRWTWWGGQWVLVTHFDQEVELAVCSFVISGPIIHSDPTMDDAPLP